MEYFDYFPYFTTFATNFRFYGSEQTRKVSNTFGNRR